MVNAAGAFYCDYLMRFGVRVFLFQEGMLHAKTLTIDDELGMFGSANYDIRSFSLNFELNLFVHAGSAVEEMRALQEGYLDKSLQAVPGQWPSQTLEQPLEDESGEALQPADVADRVVPCRTVRLAVMESAKTRGAYINAPRLAKMWAHTAGIARPGSRGDTMAKTFEQGKQDVVKLCQHFTTNRQAFFAPGVKEAHIRQMLIDPFFEALGWDVRSAAMVAPQYREVIPEDSLDVEGQQKAPDYTFRVGTLPKFYAEAKKCGVNIGTDPAPAYQLRRYGWSAKLALSILTDFEELAVYDCTIRPRQSDKASHARVLYFGYEEYPDRWRELWGLFSREAVWSGAFDQYAASKRKRGTSEVDAEFLKEIEGWRDALARNIALRNKDISSDDLNAAVQSTIDRVVFLRMAEDRRLEPSEQLLKLCERDDIYSRFMRDLCRKADEKYNSGLFHFHKEEDTDEDPDRITPKLTVDDKVFKPILQSLYFAHGSPYQFDLLPVEILGTVYERFLGKVIRLTAGHQAKVEEKPEVRKAGGVYYTPKYIVDYIVEHTVGPQIEGKSPAELAGGKGKPPFRVLDMACGSGSFLLGAYQRLLDHCLKWYVEHNPEKHKKAVYKDPRNGHWRLTIGEKKRILTTHIFGVDIDAQAVEVTKLSLLLKVLEGETDQSVIQQQRLFHDRALPNLSDNIKCGNSLIGPDYFTGKLISDSEEMKRVNPFDWKQGFPDAMKAGGFDCIHRQSAVRPDGDV